MVDTTSITYFDVGCQEFSPTILKINTTYILSITCRSYICQVNNHNL